MSRLRVVCLQAALCRAVWPLGCTSVVQERAGAILQVEMRTFPKELLCNVQQLTVVDRRSDDSVSVIRNLLLQLQESYIIQSRNRSSKQPLQISDRLLLTTKGCVSGFKKTIKYITRSKPGHYQLGRECVG